MKRSSTTVTFGEGETLTVDLVRFTPTVKQHRAGTRSIVHLAKGPKILCEARTPLGWKLTNLPLTFEQHPRATRYFTWEVKFCRACYDAAAVIDIAERP